MKLEFSRQSYEKLPKKISWKSVQWEPRCSIRTDGQTERYRTDCQTWRNQKYIFEIWRTRRTIIIVAFPTDIPTLRLQITGWNFIAWAKLRRVFLCWRHDNLPLRTLCTSCTITKGKLNISKTRPMYLHSSLRLYGVTLNQIQAGFYRHLKV